MNAEAISSTLTPCHSSRCTDPVADGRAARTTWSSGLSKAKRTKLSGSEARIGTAAAMSMTDDPWWRRPGSGSLPSMKLPHTVFAQ